MSLMGKAKVAAGVTAVLFAAHAYQSGAAASPAHLTDVISGGTVHGGTLDCAGLERLWERAGGSPSAARMAASIAMAESGGRQYASLYNTNGTTDRGYFQINSVHGSLSTFDAYGNARAAVLISQNGTDWSAWVTYQTGAYAGRC